MSAQEMTPDATSPMWTTRSVICVLSLLASLVCFASSVWACPGCKDALVEPTELPQRLGAARGYAASIALLLLVPAGLVGGIAALIWRSQRPPRADDGAGRGN